MIEVLARENRQSTTVRWFSGMLNERLHHIQRDIINSLAYASPLRFSQLQPKRIPNNTFSYHLKKLIETGYIMATAEGYIPTRKAQKTLPYSDYRGWRAKRPSSLIFLYVTNMLGEVLLLKRPIRPYKDWLGLVSGPIFTNETMEQAALRELEDKVGIHASVDELRSHGVLSFRYVEPVLNDTFIHAISFIYSYTYTGTPEAFLRNELERGALLWSRLDHADIFPEVFEITDMIMQDTFTIRSVDFEEPLLN